MKRTDEENAQIQNSGMDWACDLLETAAKHGTPEQRNNQIDRLTVGACEIICHVIANRIAHAVDLSTATAKEIQEVFDSEANDFANDIAGRVSQMVEDMKTGKDTDFYDFRDAQSGQPQ